MLSKEELLMPRYKVIESYPGSRFVVGEVLFEIKGATTPAFSFKEWCPGDADIEAKDIIMYPRLFRKLEWWENRELKDMPDYVKDSIRIYKVMGYNLPIVTVIIRQKGVNNNFIADFEPGTEDEYIAQQNNTNAATPTNTNAAE